MFSFANVFFNGESGGTTKPSESSKGNFNETLNISNRLAFIFTALLILQHGSVADVIFMIELYIKLFTYFMVRFKEICIT